jgi:hypothetical protein
MLNVKIERTSDGFDRKAFRLEFVNPAAGMASGLQQIRNWRVWRGQPPPKQKRNLRTSSISIRGARKVGALPTCDRFSPPLEEKREKRGKPLDDGENLD